MARQLDPAKIRKVLHLSADTSDTELRTVLETVRTKAEAQRATLPPAS